MSKKNPKVDAYFNRPQLWSAEQKKLRTILLDTDLTEELKWGKPGYTFEKSNVIVIQGFKAYCALLFMKGMLLKDPHGMLVKTGENTRVGRQIRFTSVEQIVRAEQKLRSYVQQAIAIEKSGQKVARQEPEELDIPSELRNRFQNTPELKTAFDALTPGRQRGYVFYFTSAKQPKTRESRIDKCVPLIRDGRGLND